ncbi:hypothetical protein [Agromyces seonyuensis]|uniref:Uncharacterized protein n=1 Tax=Agromyces seonyuensis TaxID=2662446 RepID=A0A6I4P041_9MICO|nr:hypothetical protein [Agromyces seonyuensis]MWB99993.1 hypothetical protein [Agromyces seonyuensis]
MPAQPEAERLLAHARAAHERGDALLHLQVDVAHLGGAGSSWGSSENHIVPDESTGYFLSHVESIGWRLEHAGWTFVETGANTSARVWGTGEGVVNRGPVTGFFVFRRAAAPTA